MTRLQSKYFIIDNPERNIFKFYLKTLLYFFKTVFYKITFLKVHSHITEKKYKVSVCAIFKNEAPYLKEWIEYHQLIGIDHFYMYNNKSDDDFKRILKPYIEKGIITLIDWPYDQKQMEAYKDCIINFAFETKWLGFIDIDEFVVPKSTDNIYDFLKSFENRGSIKIYWKLYGTSGKLDRNMDGLVTEDFTVCWPKHCDIGKCFYNTAYGFDISSKNSKCLHHSFWANWKGRDIPPVNAFGKICVGNRNKADSVDFPIQINHYFTKTYKEYAKKKAKGDVYFKENPHDEEYFYEHEMKCTCTDYSIYKYMIKLKLAMAENGAGGVQ